MTTTPSDNQDNSNATAPNDNKDNGNTTTQNATPNDNQDKGDTNTPQTVVGDGGEVSEKSEKAQKKKWDYSHYLLISVIVGAVGFFAYYLDLVKVPSFGQKIGVIDTSLLVMAVSVEVNEDFKKGKITLEQSQGIINEYVDQMYKQAEAYAADGYTVIPSQNVMFYSDKHDLTEKIANDIGVSYEAGAQALKDNKMSNTAGNVFKNQSNVLSNKPNVNFEDHTNLEVTTNDEGQTSDLELYNGQN